MATAPDVNGSLTVEGLTAENHHLKEEVARLQGEVCELKPLEAVVKRLEQEKADIAAERDGYLKSLHFLLREEWTITAEEVAELDKHGVPFDEKFIEELERDMEAQERAMEAQGPSDG